ncbi:hypothetical protein ACLOJK_020899 [Asimina triloba]
MSDSTSPKLKQYKAVKKIPQKRQGDNVAGQPNVGVEEELDHIDVDDSSKTSLLSHNVSNIGDACKEHGEAVGVEDTNKRDRREKQWKGKENVTIETMRNASDGDCVYNGEDDSRFELEEFSNNRVTRTKRIPRNKRFSPNDLEDPHLYVGDIQQEYEPKPHYEKVWRSRMKALIEVCRSEEKSY